MEREKIITITNKELIKDLSDDVIKLYPLKFFCCGYSTEFSIDEIDDFVLINRILDDSALDKLENILKGSKIKGIIFDDLGILDIVKDMNITKILLLDHISNNSVSINYYLDYVDSVVVSSDISEKEIEYIVKNVKKKIVLSVFGLKKLMYSRRKLLTNYALHEEIDYKDKIKAKINDKEFIIKENEYGTCFYAYPYYNALSLKKYSAYYWYDLIDLDNKTILDILNDKVNIPTSRLFLDKETIYKLRGDK